ncbi:Serine/threonine kinase [Crocosphaera watsonii WH 0005]|uniref:Serine/threonine kinase n=2 Tax=Crocosphaera watsonii TaxID=263511 RepID=T2ITP1_CROWT|nr:serine/threonine-protein kinase [Crocosphaera watsonii]CCQ55505.1 Serine/threonine kinase [Crocosphaera watsonii WH 0005]
MNTGLQSQTMVNDRFLILRQLGQGKLGRTYLAKDLNRFNESCVLQEFAPHVYDVLALRKTEELFQRKAQILYTLDHPQIPRFRELFFCQQGEKMNLFLVQDYVEGSTYRQQIQQRLKAGNLFTEIEVQQFLLGVLPVLHYLHEKGIIHRDITPNNIICRQTDNLPILIDFGSVKQLSTIANTYFKNPELLTTKIVQVGQPGYAPQEQIEQGIVTANSDLYGLAATACSLLTGKDPLELQDRDNLGKNFFSDLPISSYLRQILGKMLAKNPGDRYSSAQEIIKLLNQSSPQPLTPPTLVVKSAIMPQTSPAKEIVSSRQKTEQNMTATNSKNSPITGCLGKLFLLLMLILGSGTMGWWAGKLWISQILNAQENNQSTPIFSEESSTPKISDQELERKTEINTRRRQLGLDHSWFVGVVDELFWNKYPEQKDNILSNGKDDVTWRNRWDEIAIQVLDSLESLSSQSSQNIGSYTKNQQIRWKQQANGLYLSSRALYDLVDGRFFAVFPEQENEDFVDEPIGQIWKAMIFDTITSLQAGDNYERLGFELQQDGKIKRQETLKSGQGDAYVANLNANQRMEVKLKGDRNLLLSVYSPTGRNNILEDSGNHRWSGELIESGYYEFTVVSKSKKVVNYELNITVID